MSQSVYCKCKNTYVVECDRSMCKAPYYWEQGIGDLDNNTVSNITSLEEVRGIESTLSVGNTPNNSNVTKVIDSRSISNERG